MSRHNYLKITLIVLHKITCSKVYIYDIAPPLDITWIYKNSLNHPFKSLPYMAQRCYRGESRLAIRYISAIYCLQICVQTLEGCRLSLNFPRIKRFVDTFAYCANPNRIFVPINIWTLKLQPILHVHISNLYSER